MPLTDIMGMDGQNDNTFEFILGMHNSGDSAFIKSLLDAEGIIYFIQGEHVAPYIYHALPMRLLVRADQAAQAKELLQDFKGAGAYDGLK